MLTALNGQEIIKIAKIPISCINFDWSLTKLLRFGYIVSNLFGKKEYNNWGLVTSIHIKYAHSFIKPLINLSQFFMIVPCVYVRKFADGCQTKENRTTE